MKEKSFSFKRDALMDETGGRPPCVFTYDVVEVARTNIQQLGVVRNLVQAVVVLGDQLLKPSQQGFIGRTIAGIELLLIHSGKEEEEDVEPAFKHASYKPVGFVVQRRAGTYRRNAPLELVLFVFGQHLVHEVGEELLVGRRQPEGLFFFRILENG